MGCWVVFHDVEFTTALLCKVCAPFPVTEMVNPLAAFQFSPADFPSHFYPRFSLPFLPPILQEIFPPIFTPDFAGDFPRVFFTRHFPPVYPGVVFHLPFFLCKISTRFIGTGRTPTRPSTNLQKTTRSRFLQKVSCCEPKSPLPKSHPRHPPSLIPKSLYPLKGI